MASRGRRKSVSAVETTRDLGVSTATISRALNGSPVVRRELALGTRRLRAPGVFSDDEQAMADSVLYLAGPRLRSLRTARFQGAISD